jgi:predicted DNA-binding protein (MmcQ/YjbR family)
MTIEILQDICKGLPAVTEDIKWEHDLVFSVGAKMFLVIGLDRAPVTASFKVPDEEFDQLSSSEGFKPAPYMARHKWVLIEDISLIKKADWMHYTKQSYELVKAKLPARTRQQLGL